MANNLRDLSGEPTDTWGSVGQLDDGRSFVHFERHLPYSVEQVWAAITEPDQLAEWFPGLDVELRAGGRFEIRFGGDCEGPPHVSGTVTTFDPPHVLELGTMRYELSPEGPGCHLTFTDVLWFDGPRSTREITNSVLGGWHNFLEALEAHLDGHNLNDKRPEFDYASVEIPGRGSAT